MENKLLIAIQGPTAVGKTPVAIALAQALHTVIISADSRQFYKEMKIGTAVPSFDDRAKVPHHFVQHLSIQESYSVGKYEEDAIPLIEKLFETHESILLVGGSGLYAQAVTQGLDQMPASDAELRAELMCMLDKQGLEWAQQRLKELDLKSFQTIDLQNPHRVLRAIEVSLLAGKPYSDLRNLARKPRNFKTLKIGLIGTREWLYERIDRRVDKMIEEGLLDEVKGLLPHKNLQALSTVGYKELFQYLEEKWDFQTAVREIKKNSRRYAKRQLTWLHRDKEILWLDVEKETLEKTVEKILDSIRTS